MTASFAGPKAHAVFPDATVPVGSTFNESMETNQSGISAPEADEPQFSSTNDKPVPNAHSQVHRTKPHRDDGD